LGSRIRQKAAFLYTGVDDLISLGVLTCEIRFSHLCLGILLFPGQLRGFGFQVVFAVTSGLAMEGPVGTRLLTPNQLSVASLLLPLSG
jgi:hypothetical protein